MPSTTCVLPNTYKKAVTSCPGFKYKQRKYNYFQFMNFRKHTGRRLYSFRRVRIFKGYVTQYTNNIHII